MVNSYIIISPSSGVIGTVVTINGNSFLPTTVVTASFAGTTQTFTTDGSGNFTGNITFPSSAYDDNLISVTDGTNTATALFNLLPLPEYCSVEDIADWLGIDITENSNPSIRQVTKWILNNQERIDYDTGHSWQNQKFYFHDQANAWSQFDWGRGMPVYLKHRFVQPFDTTKGDTFEIWDGQAWQPQANDPVNFFIYFDEQKGIAYVRGYLYTIIIANRFRISYRYGGNNEGTRAVPRDISKACLLLTASDIISRDFKFSQVAYGAEGSVPKATIMDRWQKEAEKIIDHHGEIHTII